MTARMVGRWAKVQRVREAESPAEQESGFLPIPIDPIESARIAGLRYVRDTDPGIRRTRSGDGFTYVAPDGHTIHDRATLDRIRSLAIPPAYTDVWICPDPLGHIQATGLDARGRKQYRYHAQYRQVRDATKFGKMLPFSDALPRIRRRVDADLARRGLPRSRVLAAIVRLLESTAIRIGNDEYARMNHHFGLTTLRHEHVAIQGATLRFQFVGKHGKVYRCHITDRRLAKIVQRCQELPGEKLFEYIDDWGKTRSIGSGDVNVYLHEIGGDYFTAKDFRTWAGTMLAADVLREMDRPPNERGIKRAITRAIERVAEQLNNTRAVCRKYYVHPAVPAAFASGILRDAVTSIRGPKPGVNGLDPFEVEVRELLRQWVEQVWLIAR